ncbi:MAG: cyclic pyranopterin monophosphate synthase MoaC [Deltaproteobacteria bacterium]|nr:MAG: cyclic pyranopterin monophosphate synthase MoaC [Deltaproteobacteria bacterium]
MAELTHVDGSGRARMVDVGPKPVVFRRARARGKIRLQPGTVELVRANQVKKGDVLGTAQLAGVMAAKATPSLIPLCHPLVIDHVRVDCTLEADGVMVESEVRCSGKTGVEMEALCAVSVALLTVYDMCKAVDKAMVIESVELVEKEKREDV